MLDADQVAALVEPAVERASAELVDLEIVGSRGRPIVRAYVDTEEGVTVDACARLSRLIEETLERAGAVPERYVLEVSSPGLERRLKKRHHFERFCGRDIKLRLHRRQGGARGLVGTLEEVVDEEAGEYGIVVRDTEGNMRTVSSNEIAHARLHITW
jgi:ribosome maturation factor RimP